jgi:hypothetical protein
MKFEWIRAREKSLIDAGVVETRHWAAIKAQCAFSPGMSSHTVCVSVSISVAPR